MVVTQGNRGGVGSQGFGFGWVNLGTLPDGEVELTDTPIHGKTPQGPGGAGEGGLVASFGVNACRATKSRNVPATWASPVSLSPLPPHICKLLVA